MRHLTILYVIILTFVTGVGMAQIDLEKYPANPVLNLGDDGSWDEVHVSHPCVLFDGSMYHLWYVGDNGSQRDIGYARSDNGVSWEKYPGNPVLNDGLGDVWDGDFVSQPCVLHNGTQYRMWYAGYDGTNMRIGYATSDDGIVWNKHDSNPVLNLGTSGSWDAMGVSSPTVVLENDNLRMWYTGYDGGKMVIGLSYRLGDCVIVPQTELIAHAHANPATCEATSPDGAEVTLDGSQSIGSDGTPITDPNAYEWDLNNDGDFSDATGLSVTHVYPLGEHTAALRVTDSGESSMDTVHIKVEDTRPPLVKLLSPYGGEVYQGGGAVTIRWEPATDVVSLQNNAIALYYNSDGGDWQLITQDEANDGLYEWTASTLDSDNVKVKIEATDATGNVGNDTSAASFTLDSQLPVVELTSPSGGEVMLGGSVFPITWQPATDNFSLTDAPIRLSYSTDGTTWELIAEGERNDGQFDWNVPALDNDDLLVRVEAVDRAGNVGEDISDNPFSVDSTAPMVVLTSPIGEYISDAEFTIDSDAPVSSLTIIQPSKEQTQHLRGGSAYTILWALPQDNFSLADVALSYSADGGNDWNSIAQVMDAGSIYGRYNWDVPTEDSEQVVIRIEATDVSGNRAEDTSSYRHSRSGEHGYLI